MIKTLPIDRILLVGPIFTEVSEPSSNLDVIMERSDLEAFLKAEKLEGYHILVKGSRVMELENILKLLMD